MNQFDRSADPIAIAGDRIADRAGTAAFVASLPCDRRRDHHHARLALWRRCIVAACSTLVILLMVAVVAATIWLRVRNKNHPPPRYYAAITTADLDIGRPDRMMSTSFDLSLGVAASRGNLLTCGGYCLESGTTVQVSYHGAPLAREVVAAWEEVCALWWMPPGNTQWTTIAVAENNITALRGSLADALAADVRYGLKVFDVTLLMPDGKTTAWCAARRVGDKDKTASLCKVHYPTTLSD